MEGREEGCNVSVTREPSPTKDPLPMTDDERMEMEEHLEGRNQCPPPSLIFQLCDVVVKK